MEFHFFLYKSDVLSKEKIAFLHVTWIYRGYTFLTLSAMGEIPEP